MLLHVWNPDPAAAPRQAPTWSALPGIVAALGGPAISWPTPATSPFAYSDGIRSAWEVDRHTGGPLLLLEGDKTPTPAMARALARCPYPLCVQAYRIYPCTTGLPAPVIAAFSPEGGLRWIREGEEWASGSGLGFFKIGGDLVRSRVIAPTRWGHDFDRRILQQLGFRVHVHWPEMPHHHDY